MTYKQKIPLTYNQPSVIESNIRSRDSFYRTSDNSWISVSTSWGTKPRKGNISGRGTEESLPVLVDIIKKEMKKRKYEKVEPYDETIIGKEKYDYAKRIVDLVEQT